MHEMVPAHKETCVDLAVQSLNDNALADGCMPPAHGHWTAWDGIPEWDATVAEIIKLWLSDGTASCTCS